MIYAMKKRANMMPTANGTHTYRCKRSPTLMSHQLTHLCRLLDSTTHFFDHKTHGVTSSFPLCSGLRTSVHKSNDRQMTWSNDQQMYGSLSFVPDPQNCRTHTNFCPVPSLPPSWRNLLCDLCQTRASRGLWTPFLSLDSAWFRSSNCVLPLSTRASRRKGNHQTTAIARSRQTDYI